jgi:N-methylhydantoinase B
MEVGETSIKGNDMTVSNIKPGLDPVLMTVLANRLDGVVREMSNTLLRTARSTVIAMARDFSCAIVTGNNEVLASAEGLPVHMFGADLQCRAMTDLHNDIAEGDAFLHNDPYMGNTHAADQTVLVPVFVDGEHLFTTCAKAHQADIGNSIPTTYHAGAKDVYEEGAVLFPCVRLQTDYQMNEDIVRMGMQRIRVPRQWYGDLLAAIGSARIGERRLKDLCAKYGTDTIKTFIREWFDYSERRMIQAIRELPSGTTINSGVHDPIPPIVDQPIPVNIKLTIDANKGKISVDLRDNIDCLPCGLNQSEATATTAALTGVFNCIDPSIPHNQGSFRRLKVHLREGSAVGKVKHPHSCSMATTNLADKIIGLTQGAFAKLGEGYGLSEGSNAFGPNVAVVSGTDYRHDNSSFVNQLFINAGAGPAGPAADGWTTFGIPVAAGLLYRDSIELDEIKQPMHIKFARLTPGTCGAGRRRGGSALELAYGPRKDPMTIVFACDNTQTPPRGVNGGQNGALAVNRRIGVDGTTVELPSLSSITLQPGEFVYGRESSSGGYGDPLQREPERVCKDVLEHIETRERARDIYGVELTGCIEEETLAVDLAATEALRAARIDRS